MNHPLSDLSDRLPLRVLLPLGLVLFLLWAFATIADEVGEGDTRGVDERVLQALRTDDPADPIGPEWFEESARDLTALGSNAVLLLVVAAVGTYLVLRRHAVLSAVVVGACLAGLGANRLLKLGFDRPRPELVPHEVQVFSSSFPSGHSMAAALIWLTLAALLARVERRRRLQAFILGFALLIVGLVGLSRVYLGVHYPTDVLAGWALGAAWAVVTGWGVDTLRARSRSS